MILEQVILWPSAVIFVSAILWISDQLAVYAPHVDKCGLTALVAFWSVMALGGVFRLFDKISS